MKTEVLPSLPLGDIGICVIQNEVFQWGGYEYKAPLKPGKYILTSFGDDSLLLMRCTSESSQLLSEVSRGICLSESPFHIQAHILQLSRIPLQNHNGRKTPKLSNTHRGQLQALPEFRRNRKGGKDCNSPRASNSTSYQYKSADCNGNRRNNKHIVFQKFGSCVKTNTKSKKITGRKK